MPDHDPTHKLHGLDPGELLARSLDTVKPTGGATAWEPPTPEELAKLLPQYRIESLLGRGGMGAVYKGVQAALDRPVAIKLLPAELAADRDFLPRFQREARTLAKLQHPGIVTVYDFGQTTAGHLYFVMEFVDGTDLQHVLKGPGLQPPQAFEMIAQICDALYYAHTQGVIHRDIKPANILVTKAGRAKVADFGLARPLTEETGGLTQTNMVMGTPDYMAPEQRSGIGHPDHRADIFALGVMLYEMLTGQRPHGAFQPPSQKVQVDVRIDEVVLKALQQEPDRRYQQASEMKVDVDRIRTTPPEKVKPAGGRRSLAAVAAIVVLAIAAIAFFLHQRSTSGDSQKKATATTPVSPAGKNADTGAPEKSGLAWRKGESSAADWQKRGWAVENGWVNLLTPHTGQPIPIFTRPAKEAALPRFAVRAHAKFNKSTGWAGFHFQQPGEAMFSVNFYTNMTIPAGRNNGGNIAKHHAVSASVGDDCLIEMAVIDEQVYTKFNGGWVQSFAVAQLPACQQLNISGTGSSVKDLEYAILDGIADPLKALGWEAPREGSATTPVSPAGKKADANAPEKNSLEWQRVEHTEAEWQALGNRLDNGWVHLDQRADVFNTKSKTQAHAKFAVRALAKFGGGKKGPGSYVIFERRNQTDELKLIQFWRDFVKVHTSDGIKDQRYPFLQGDEASVEAAVIDGNLYTRFNHGPVSSFSFGSLAPCNLLTISGNDVRVRDIEYANLDGIADPLKALGWEVPQENASKPAVANATAEEGFRPLFDGRTLTGWRALDRDAPSDSWRVVDGSLTGTPRSCLMTRDEFGDFDLRWEWRVSRQGNGGVYYRVAEEGMKERPMSAVEFQLIDDSLAGGPMQVTGSVQDLLPATEKAAHPPGEWNTARLLVQGTRVEHWINDRLVCQYDLADPATPASLRGAAPGGKVSTAKKARLALQAWGGDVFYRNLRIREPDATPTTAASSSGTESQTPNASAPAISAAILEARQKGGRLRAFGSSHSGPLDLSTTAQFTDFQTVSLNRNGWAARRVNGDTYCMAGLGPDHAKPVALGPYRTSFLQHSGFPIMRMSDDGSYRNIFGGGESQVRKDWSYQDSAAFLNPSDHITVLAKDGTILLSENWHGKGAKGRLAPPADFFLGATAYAATSNHYISARPGQPVRSFDVGSGAVTDFPATIRNIVEMEGTGGEVILLDATGHVFVTKTDGQPYRVIPSKLGPAIAVRAGANMFAAQMIDGSWQAWGDGDELIEQTRKIGHAIDVDFYCDAPGKPAYMMWIEPVDSGAALKSAPQPPVRK